MKETTKFAITILVALLPLFISLITKDKKALEYTTSSFNLIEDGIISEKSPFALYHHDQKLKSLHLDLLLIKNSGNVPIQKSDYIDKLTIDVAPGSTILESKLIEPMPIPSDFKATLNNNKISIDPLLINKNETLQLAIFTTGNEPKPKLHTRIIGADSVTHSNRHDFIHYTLLHLRWLGCALLFGAFTFGVIFKTSVRFNRLFMLFGIMVTEFSTMRLAPGNLTSWGELLLAISIAILGAVYISITNKDYKLGWLYEP